MYESVLPKYLALTFDRFYEMRTSGRRFGVNSGSSRLARLHWLNLSCFQYYP